MWRNAVSILTVRDECDARWSDRDRKSDGTIGDASHATRNSDHNPWVKDANGIGVVRAIDIDAGPGLNPDEAHDQVGDEVAEAARRAGLANHPAMGPGSYVIYERRIASAKSNPPWSWRPYTGTDPHTSHPHISVTTRPGAGGYDSHQAWGIAKPPAPPKRKILHPPGSRTLRRTPGSVRDRGADFHWLARVMGHPNAAHFGGGIERNVKRFQRQHGLPADGVVGPRTWRKLLKVEGK